MGRKKKNLFAGIEYHGQAGASKDCQDAIMRLLQYGDKITHARILTCAETYCKGHCFLLTVGVGDLVAIKSGFSSGYRGEGPRTFSYVLQLLNAHGVEIEEFEVGESVIERLDSSSLTRSDINKLDAARPVRPARWSDYIFDKDWDREKGGTLWEEFDPVIPLGIIDSRIIDLALSFWEDPDDKLLTGYRRLEDIVRERAGIDQHGAKLFGQAFVGDVAKLGWKGLGRSEQTGRGNLFVAAYMAHRNPRAHRELEEYANSQLTEFLLLNHLFLLEKEATEQEKGG